MYSALLRQPGRCSLISRAGRYKAEATSIYKMRSRLLSLEAAKTGALCVALTWPRHLFLFLSILTESDQKNNTEKQILKSSNIIHQNKEHRYRSQIMREKIMCGRVTGSKVCELESLVSSIIKRHSLFSRSPLIEIWTTKSFILRSYRFSTNLP